MITTFQSILNNQLSSNALGFQIQLSSKLFGTVSFFIFPISDFIFFPLAHSNRWQPIIISQPVPSGFHVATPYIFELWQWWTHPCHTQNTSLDVRVEDPR